MSPAATKNRAKKSGVLELQYNCADIFSPPPKFLEVSSLKVWTGVGLWVCGRVGERMTREPVGVLSVVQRSLREMQR